VDIPVFLASLVKEGVYSPMYVFGTFVENHMAVAAWVYFWLLYHI
jgi:hypothetical protein